ncbi:MAG: chloride channel protein [Bacteroidales bacterium]
MFKNIKKHKFDWAQFKWVRIGYKALIKQAIIPAIIIGAISGLAAVLLKNGVYNLTAWVHSLTQTGHLSLLYFFLPIIGIVLTVIFTNKIIKEKLDHGVTRVLKAVRKNKGAIRPHNIYSNIVACVITASFGGSIGMEGPIVTTGAAIGSNTAKFFDYPHKYKLLFICAGMSSAIAAIFKAPIAGLIFSIEILAIDLSAGFLIPVLLSCVTGTIVATFFLGQKAEFYFAVFTNYNYSNTLFFILLGIFVGLLSVYFLRTYSFIEKSLVKIKKKTLRILIGGGLLGLLIYLFPPLYGEGYNNMEIILSGNIEQLFSNSIIYPYFNSEIGFLILLIILFFMKVIATALTTGAGGVGGVFAPALFTGAVGGTAFAILMNILFNTSLNVSNFTLVGMAGVMAGVIQTPLAAIFLIAELTGGYNLFIPLIITATISYATTRLVEPYSIYTKSLAESGELLTHDKEKNVFTLLDKNDLIETEFVTLNINQKLSDLIEAIKICNRNVFPVLNDDNNLVGLIYFKDIKNIIFDKQDYDKISISELMKEPEIVIDINESLDSIVEKVRMQNIWNIPVVDHGKYVGFISKSSLLSAYQEVFDTFTFE